jgi:hypothetical protein
MNIFSYLSVFFLLLVVILAMLGMAHWGYVIASGILFLVFIITHAYLNRTER